MTQERPTPETDAFFRTFADGEATPSHAEYFDRMTRLERERDNALSDLKQAEVDCLRALHERNEAREQRDRLAEALRNCREDSVELLGERHWWQEETRGDYRARYEETAENIRKADAALAAVEGGEP